MRASHNGKFFIFDEGNIVMLFNGFQKKTQKTGIGNRKCIETKKYIMQAGNDIGSFDDILDEKYGKAGTPERDAFHQEVYSYCVGQIIHDVRKKEQMTQSDLAKKVGTDKTYISRIEKGMVEK